MVLLSALVLLRKVASRGAVRERERDGSESPMNGLHIGVQLARSEESHFSTMEEGTLLWT